MQLEQIKAEVDRAVREIAGKDGGPLGGSFPTKRGLATLGRLQGLLEAAIAAKDVTAAPAPAISQSDVILIDDEAAA